MTSKKIGFLTGIALIFGSIGYSQGLTSRQLKASTIKNGSGVLTLPTTTDTLVGRATTDTMTNKTLTTPSTDVITYDDQGSTPSNPSAGFYKSYIKTDGKAYILNSTGTESRLGSGGGVFEASQNLITNNSFESDTTGWTASGGTFVRVTAAANIIPPGLGAGSWDPSATSQTLSFTSTTVTANDGLSGRNGVISCAIKTAATDLKMQAYDGTNVLTSNSATDVVPSSSTGFLRYSLNFIIPSSGTIQARFLSASDSAIAYIDDCFFGLAEGFNISNVSQAQFIGSAFFAPTSACAWTKTAGTSLAAFATDTDCPGPTVELNPGPGVIQTTDANLPRVTINNLPPGNYTVVAIAESVQRTQSNTSTLTINDGTSNSGTSSMALAVGEAQSMTLVGNFQYTTAGNRTFEIFAATEGTATSEITNTPTNTATRFSFYRYPLSSETGLSTDKYSQSWSGYHDNTCSWARSNSVFGDPTADAACALTQRTATNMTFAASGSVLPQITGSMDVADYMVCATSTAFQGTAGASGALQLWDGTTVIAQQGFDADTGADETKGHTLCGLYRPTSSGSKTLSLQSRASSGSITMSGNPVAVEWSVVKISQSFPAPLLVGSVTSNSSGLERSERARINCDASSSITTQSGTWISSVGNRSTTSCVVTIASGIFSAAPVCSLLVESSTVQAMGIASTSATSITVYGPNADYDANLLCQGPR